MVKVYGITTCGSVKKAIAFFKAKVVPYSFIDLKSTQISEAKRVVKHSADVDYFQY